MASSPLGVLPETLITIKVNHDGSTKKVKLPFADLAPACFEDKLRAALSIASTTPCRFERYSDSAGRFVVLDRDNASVYKQLIRAAKAKQKLKLRVVYPEPAPAAEAELAETSADANPAPAKPGPRPVTIEDMPEAASDSARSFEELMQFGLRNMSRRSEMTPRNTVDIINSYQSRIGAQAKVRDDSLVKGVESLRIRPAPSPIPKPLTAPAPAPAPIPAPSKPVLVSSEMAERKPTADAAAKPQPSTTAIPFSQQFNALLSAQEQVEKERAAKEQAVSSTEVAHPNSVAASAPEVPPPFNVHCNSCSRRILNTHYHCSTCEEDDFDLCLDCVDLGLSCYNPDHWMIRRTIQNGLIVRSTTRRLPPKSKTAKTEPATAAPAATPAVEAPKATATTATAAKTAATNATKAAETNEAARYAKYLAARSSLFVLDTEASTNKRSSAHQPSLLQPLPRFRTCNNCIRELPEAHFLHCKVCYDFDLCRACIVKNDHGHHPNHMFSPAVEGTVFDRNVTRLLSPGRGERHNAVCDGCDSFIVGVRHKCLNCPDWDYCSNCVLNADFIHPGHRFLPIYEPLPNNVTSQAEAHKQVHTGIYCDGPLCASVKPNMMRPYIVGDRYKCAICDNKDFCACCEASPANKHNKSHPLIKFRTPLRHVSVTTTGEHGNGVKMPVMGDSNIRPSCPRLRNSTPEGANAGTIQLNKVQTVVDVKPTGTAPPPPAPSVATSEPATKKKTEAAVEPSAEKLGAIFLRDTVADGTAFPPNHVFEQTWVLRNTGSVAWPAGCCVRFVSGDYMGHVDPNHPAGIQELVSASESTICYQPLAPGAQFPFTVLLRTPSRLGKVISYWRLTTKGGIKFGDRLWCDVSVVPKEEEATPASKAVPEKEVEHATAAAEKPKETAESSQMIFPKLEKESPVASIHEPATTTEADAGPAAEQASELEDWEDDDSVSGFLTDEEYDILDASDEEFGMAQQK